MRKILIGILIISAIIFTVSLNVLANPHGYRKEVYNESLQTFELIDKAFKENRPLTSYEKMKLVDFEAYASTWRDKTMKKNRDYTEQEVKEAKLLTSISFLGDIYTSYDSSSSSSSLLNDKYREAKILLGVK